MENTIPRIGMSQSDETNEVIGLLTAISIVSKRMATKLALLDQQIPPRKEEAHYEHTATAAGHADQGHAV